MKNPYNNFLQVETINDIIDRKRGRADFNVLAAEQQMLPRNILYTSKRVLTTTAGSRIYPVRAGMITNIFANVQGAPTGALTWDILKNGVSIFTTKPTIASGSFYNNVTEFIPNNEFLYGDYFQVQVTTINSATGPIVVRIEYLPVGIA